jgi:hypothetical protein
MTLTLLFSMLPDYGRNPMLLHPGVRDLAECMLSELIKDLTRRR